METPIGTPAITPSTRFSASIAKIVIGAVVLVSTAISATAAVMVLKSDIAAVDKRVTDHINDAQVHLDKNYYRGHGDVIGKFDLNIAAAQISASVDDLRKTVNDLTSEIHQKKASK